MVQIQILNKCLLEGNIDLIEDNQLTEDYFTEYRDEYKFIVDHYKKYNTVPDKETLASVFNDFEFVSVSESNTYLVNTVREEYLYYKSVPIIQKAAELLKTDANAYIEYMSTALKDLQPNYGDIGIDIIAQADKRYKEFTERRLHQDKWFFSSGFPELDDTIHGIQRTEEFILIYARTNIGKSWVLEKITTSIWESGNNVGYFSPEMGDSSIGYRFDTLHMKFDNTSLKWGKDDVKDSEYSEYIDNIKKSNTKFIVSSPKDFNNSVTISRLRNWIKKYDLKMLAIDGVTYLDDERYKKGDTEATKLTHLGEDLMSLSIEMNIPVLAVIQANRSGVTDKDTNDTPELESVRGGDGLSFNASKVLALKQNKDGNLIIEIKKQRDGVVGKKVAYEWSPNIGKFNYIAINDDNVRSEHHEQTQRTKRTIESKEDVF